jgi:hypothetical protein
MSSKHICKVHGRITLATAAVLCTALSVFAQGEVQVRVTGRGESEWSARNDAIRQALQQAMSQLVIADRVISDDKVLRDTVMSTMNGFVDRVEPIRTYKDGNEIVTELNVGVSKTRIENFLGGSTGASASVRGSDLSAGLQGELLSRTARAQILWRLFAGYPGKAIEIKVEKIGLSEQDPNLIIVDYSFSTDKAFLSSLKQGLKALGRAPTPSRPKKESASTSDTKAAGSWLGKLGKTLDQQMVSANTDSRVANSSSPSMVCITSNPREQRESGSRLEVQDCYPLPPGDYRSQYPEVSNWHMSHHHMLLLVDFVDQSGNSLLRTEHVLGIESGDTLLTIIPKIYSSDSTLRIELSAFNGRRGRFAVSVGEIADLSKVARVAIMPVATDWSSRGVGHEEGSPYRPIDWSRSGPFTELCQKAVLFDMPACTSLEDAVGELRLKATR